MDLRDFVRDHVFPYMASLVKEEPQIAEYFRDAVLEVVDPNVLNKWWTRSMAMTSPSSAPT
jgi:type I restriction enzyme M protein